MSSAFAVALLAAVASLYWQSPRRRLSGGEPYRYAARVRALTMVTVAALILGLGFYVAGVPTGAGVSTASATVPAAGDAAAVGGDVAAADAAAAAADTAAATEISTNGAVSGAFSGPPPTAVGATIAATEGSTSSADLPPSDAPVTPSPSATPTPTDLPPTATTQPTATATPTPSATPTSTPTPTLTPTPISGPTARIDTGGSTLWVRQTPGGRNIALVRSGDVVLLRDGIALQGGIEWAEVMTVDGVIGWVQREYLAVDA